LRQEGKEENRQLGIEQVHQDCVPDHLPVGINRAVGLDLHDAIHLQRHPCHIQQIGNARALDRVESECAGMQERRQTSDCCQHVRHDAKCAAQGSHDRAACAARQARRHRHECASPGRSDNDQRGDQELESHRSRTRERNTRVAVSGRARRRMLKKNSKMGPRMTA
jgi:hypothetical protein